MKQKYGYAIICPDTAVRVMKERRYKTAERAQKAYDDDQMPEDCFGSFRGDGNVSGWEEGLVLLCYK